MSSEILYRSIVPSDAIAYRQLQRDSCLLSERSFYQLPNETASVERINSILQNLDSDSFRFGAFVDEKLIGLICFNRNKLQKIAHRGELFGFFVYPEYRGKEIGANLLLKAIDRIREIPGLTHIDLSVMVDSDEAIALYRKNGFTEVGRKPAALKINDEYIDELFMSLTIDR